MAKAKAKKPAQPTLRVGKPRRHRLQVPPPVETAGQVPERLSPNMVDRLFWRAGFGPSAADRATWTGKLVTEAVDALLSTPEGALVGPEPTRDGKKLDPFGADGGDTDLVLQWVDRMIRTPTPFIERLTFFWHRLWANSRMEVSPPQLLVKQNALFRDYADFGKHPDADYGAMAQAVTIDPSMLRYLNGETNVRGGPNENYGRELMELFALGVFDSAGKPNYTEDDVKNMAKALSGYRLDDTDPNNVTASFDSSRWFQGFKILSWGPRGNMNTADAVNNVLAHPAHAPYIVNRLWSEFVVGPPDAATLADLTKTYVDGGKKLKPLLRKILTHPQLYSSIDEPNMIKAPVIYVVGIMRALGQYVKDDRPLQGLEAMGQVPYFPPTVAGWEYGAAWLNTNTALARFDFAGRMVIAADPKPTDVLGERPEEAFARAHAACGSPWLSQATQTALLDYATKARQSSVDNRAKRQHVLRTLILAGPDAQVM
jgi:uncharacterized protein (DUF1800 family)